MYRADRNAPTEARTHASSRSLVAANPTIWSFAKKPASGGMPASDSAPIANQVAESGISARRPPIRRMSVSSCRPCRTLPAVRKSRAL